MAGKGTKSDDPDAMSPLTRWRALMARLAISRNESSQARFRPNGFYELVHGKRVFINIVTTDPEPEPEKEEDESKKKEKNKAHLSHSPLHLKRYNKNRMNAFEKDLPKGIEKLEKWIIDGGHDAEPEPIQENQDENSSDDTTAGSEEVDAEESVPGSVPVENFSLLVPDSIEELSTRTEEATVVSGNSSTRGASSTSTLGTFSRSQRAFLDKFGTRSNVGTDFDGDSKSVVSPPTENVDAVVREVVNEMVDRIDKVHETVRLIRLKLIKPKSDRKRGV